MKKRLIPALSIGITIILIGSLAYAADRRKKSNIVDLAKDKVHEEEALKTELLNALVNPEQKSYYVNDTEKVAVVRVPEKKEQTESK